MEASSVTEEARGDAPTEESEKVDKAQNEELSDKEGYDPKNVHYEGEIAIYTDPKSGYQYTWNKEKNEWEAKTNVTYGFEDDTHTYTDADGTKYFWDREKSAWFPKINDDFMAQYQMSYGFVDNTDVCNTATVKEKKEVQKDVGKVKSGPAKTGEKRKASEPTWFELDETQNTKVYVSNLPTNITEEEFIEIMQKYGIIMKDPTTQKLKIKLYTEPNTNYMKGDALCTYVKMESVELALSLLDGTEYKGKKISVERAKFQLKGEYNPNLKPKSKKKKDKLKIQKLQEKLFDWRPEKMRGERSKHEKIVIVKNVFDPKDFDENVGLILEYQQDMREECSKCGEVRKVILYDQHPEGVVQINMKDFDEADACVKLLNGRWFGKRKLSAEIWDGKTKYKIAETDVQINERINKWDKFLEAEETNKNNEKSVENTERNIENTEKDVENTERNVENAEKDVENTERNVENVEKDVENTERNVENAEKDIENTERNVENVEKDVKNTNKHLESFEKRTSEVDTR